MIINASTPEFRANVSLQETKAQTPAKAEPQSGMDEIRASYNAKISSAYENEFKPLFAKFHANEQCFGESIAKQGFEARDKIKAQHQEDTPWYGRAAISVYNYMKYGTFGNVGYEDLEKSGKNPEEIAYSAFKTGGGPMGLANNGFGEILDVWKAIKKDVIIYPEEITPAMVDVYKAQPPGKVDVAAIMAAKEGVCPLPVSAFFTGISEKV